MRNPLAGNLLIGALLDRLGHTQAQALLQRLDRLLSQEARDGPSAEDRKQASARRDRRRVPSSARCR